MREKDIESWSCRLAAKEGWWHRKFCSPGKRSAPDRIFAKNGWVIFVEFKAKGAKATDPQREEHKIMRAAGLTVYVCDSREGFAELLEHENEEMTLSFVDKIFPSNYPP